MNQWKRRTIGTRLRFEILSRDDFTCQYCGIKAPHGSLVVDHVEPVAKGGTNDRDNLAAACVPCNQGKSDKQIRNLKIRMEQQRLPATLKTQRDINMFVEHYRRRLVVQQVDVMDGLLKPDPNAPSWFVDMLSNLAAKTHEAR